MVFWVSCRPLSDSLLRDGMRIRKDASTLGLPSGHTGRFGGGSRDENVRANRPRVGTHAFG